MSLFDALEIWWWVILIVLLIGLQIEMAVKIVLKALRRRRKRGT